MAIFFTADLHLGHKNIIKFCNRPFKSIEEMDETLINNWNEVVKEDDDIFLLGDFAFSNVFKYIERLKGNKRIIPGSHDRFTDSDYLIDDLEILPSLYEFTSNLVDEFGRKRLIVLCHYAMRSWKYSHYASWHLFGHHHGRLESYGLSFDCGVDTNNFYPYSLKDVEKRMSTLKPIVDYRKKVEEI